jgi:hypothetical protein
MNDLHSPPASGGPSRHPEDLDGLLRRFFRAEMPHPWPAAPTLPRPQAALPPRKRQTRRPWLPFSMRFAVAASVALLVIGYLALAGQFSTTAKARGSRPEDTYGKKDSPRNVPPSLKGFQVPGQKKAGSDRPLQLRPLIVPGQNGGRIRVERSSSPGPHGPILELRLQRDP